jgi:hypothetical protein
MLSPHAASDDIQVSDITVQSGLNKHPCEVDLLSIACNCPPLILGEKRRFFRAVFNERGENEALS